MPAGMAVRKDCGMLLMISSRTRSTLTSKNRQPEISTAPSAACHGKPMPLTTA